MSVARDSFQVDLRGMVDLLSHHLYSSPRVYLRELVQNSADAITARAAVEPDCPRRIEIVPADVADDGFLHIHDTGIGLDAESIRSVLATIGASTKRDELGFARGASSASSASDCCPVSSCATRSFCTPAGSALSRPGPGQAQRTAPTPSHRRKHLAPTRAPRSSCGRGASSPCWGGARWARWPSCSRHTCRWNSSSTPRTVPGTWADAPSRGRTRRSPAVGGERPPNASPTTCSASARSMSSSSPTRSPGCTASPSSPPPRRAPRPPSALRQTHARR